MTQRPISQSPLLAAGYSRAAYVHEAALGVSGGIGQHGNRAASPYVDSGHIEVGLGGIATPAEFDVYARAASHIRLANSTRGRYGAPANPGGTAMNSRALLHLADIMERVPEDSHSQSTYGYCTEDRTLCGFVACAGGHAAVHGVAGLNAVWVPRVGGVPPALIVEHHGALHLRGGTALQQAFNLSWADTTFLFGITPCTPAGWAQRARDFVVRRDPKALLAWDAEAAMG